LKKLKEKVRMSTPAAAHRDNAHRTSDTVRLGALLVAVVGIAIAATSAGFTNDAWFSADASSASVSLQGRVSGTADFADADDGTVAIAVPSSVFANMVPGEQRSVDLDLRNASSVGLSITENTTATGPLVDTDSGTSIALAGTPTTMAEGQEDTVTLTITAGDWGDALQNQAADANAVTLEFTGTPIADSAAAGN
jgi:hypothetical protein